MYTHTHICVCVCVCVRDQDYSALKIFVYVKSFLIIFIDKLKYYLRDNRKSNTPEYNKI